MAILENTTITGTDASKLPSGTTAERPSSPEKGMIRHNSTFNTLEYWNGTYWRYQPDFLRNTLILRYDAAEPDSYSGTGTAVNDISYSTNTYNGTLQNGPTFDTDGGGCWVFDGTNDYIDSGTTLTEANDLFADTTASWTISAWFKPDITTTTDGAVIGRGGGTGGSATFVVYTNGTSLFVRLRGGTVLTVTTSLTNDWYEVTVIWDHVGSAAEVHLNGQYISSIAVGTAALQTYNLTIGAQANGVNTFYKGKISEVKVYTRPLLIRDVQTNFNSLKRRYGLVIGSADLNSIAALSPEPNIGTRIKTVLFFKPHVMYTGAS